MNVTASSSRLVRGISGGTGERYGEQQPRMEVEVGRDGRSAAHGREVRETWMGKTKKKTRKREDKKIKKPERIEEIAEPGGFAEPEGTAEPGGFAEPEGTAEPEGFAEPEGTAEPEGFAEPEEFAAPEGTADSEEFAESEELEETEELEEAVQIRKTAKTEETENRKLACALWTILCIGSMAVMLAFASKKTIVIADAGQNQAELAQGFDGQGKPAERPLGVNVVFGVRKRFSINLPKEVKAEQVVVENRYVSRELLLYVEKAKQGFFEENGINGDVTPVQSASSQVQDKGVLLRVRMDRVLEYKSTLEGSTLTIEWYEPRELYDYIVMLDMAGSSDGLKDGLLTRKVARLAQQKFGRQDVRLYLLGLEERELTDADKVGLAEELRADLYIRLSAAYEDGEPQVYGIKGVFNEDYYIPRFGNVELADVMTRAVTIASCNRAIGLESAGEGSILKELKVPAAELSLGYLSNDREANLLWQEDYQDKLAEGLVNGMEEAVRQLEEQGREEP